MTRLRNVAVVLAGGTGTRISLNIPKQLIKIAGKPIIEHTIAAMQQSPLVDEINGRGNAWSSWTSSPPL